MTRLTRPRIVRLRLNDFRSYARLDWATPAALVALCGPNGAGKTNILEALSLFSPGRGLRRAQAAQLTRKEGGGGYALLADVAASPEEAPVLLATALAPGERLRAARIEREPVPSAQAFLEYLSFLWLTPDQDGIFRGAAGDRRRFLDRLVLAVDSAHAARAARFENALRHRNRLLEEVAPGPRWLDAIEQEIAELGIALAAARLETVGRLAALVEREAETMAPFPFARLALEGEIEARLLLEPAAAVEDWYRRALAEGRGRDRAAGRALIGPQAADLVVIHGPKAMAAGLCSTGEQKALLIGLILVQARLIAQMRARTPVLLLDEVAAHLDESRRSALFRILEALGAQVFMTGTDALLFETIGAQGALFYVQDSAIRPIKGRIMTLSSLLIFLPVYALAVLSPGPAVAAVVSRVLARGSQGMGAFILGLILGDLTWLLAAVFGLALVVQAYASLFRLVQYAGAAYLFYVAVMMWRARPAMVAAPENAAAGGGWSAFFAAYVLTLGNPKTMVFFLSIMPLLVRPDLLDAKAVAQLALICAVVLAAVLSGYVVLALRARRLFTSSRAIRRLNRSTAALMGCTAVAVASR